MRAVMVVGLSCPALAWGGEDPAITACEVAIKSVLRSPRSYERVSARVDGPAAIVEYEAQNAYGVFIRTVQVCEFRNLNGKWRIFDLRVDDGRSSTGDLPTSERTGLPAGQSARQFEAAIDAGVGDLSADRTKLVPKLRAPGLPQGEEADRLLLSACDAMVKRDFGDTKGLSQTGFRVSPDNYGNRKNVDIAISIDYSFARPLSDPVIFSRQCIYHSADGSIGNDVWKDMSLGKEK